MSSVLKRYPFAAFLFLLSGLAASAQTSVVEFFPEVDVYHRLSSDTRFVFQAKGTSQGGDPLQGELGPSIDFYPKPFSKLKHLVVPGWDETKSRPLVFEIGYRYLPTPGKPSTNRLEPVVTAHLPVKGRFLITDRNRGDLDWSNGGFPWRYRNRLTVERRFSTSFIRPSPYVSAEFYYAGQYSKWSTTDLFAGCLLGINKRIRLDPYYEHENNTGKKPNQQINAGGLIANLYF
jgi:hypothetical protein